MDVFSPQRARRNTIRLLITLASIALLTSCRSPQIIHEEITVNISMDGKTREARVPSGSTVDKALKDTNITIGDLDRSEPPFYTVLADGDTIRLVRVREEFETKEIDVPFEHRVVRNESLPEGETRMIQPGVNGRQEVTYRTVYEDNIEVSNSIVKSAVLLEAVPEIIMVGGQSTFAPLPISGKLAYLAGGNAWIMEESTANRHPLVMTGDLDGYVFSVSPKGDWLIFSRKSKAAADKEINTLWVVNTTADNPTPINLKVSNVVHFAEWVPNTATTFVYSTVEPRATAPGWHANNDLYELVFGPGWVGKPKKIIDTNYGGSYGWWGTSFRWSPDGHLAYARPDEIGIVDVGNGNQMPLLEITPLQTHSDWAWIPGLTWGADNHTLYVVTHAPPPSLVNAEESPYFDLSAISLINNAAVPIVLQTGMFAYPSISSLRMSGHEKTYTVAYLQAIFPAQSETSRYRLTIMDRDGSNRRIIFPPKDATGLEPQTPIWAPESIPGQAGDFLAVVYQGNLWLIDSGNEQTYQITGDGLISRIDWK